MDKPNILICDDEEGVRESLRMILSGDYSLTFTKEGEEALNSLAVKAPELVIMDIKMPGMNGLEALKRIKHEKPGVPVMVITGYESLNVATEAVKSGTDDYLTKPFDRKKLSERVRVLLKKRDA